MPRRKIWRKVINPPRFKGFTPIGMESPGHPVVLGFEEVEALRLCDFDGYHHAEASRIMDVSRPTFARIYEEARRKVALAFVMGSPILFEGGKVYYDSDWFKCRSCRCRFNRIDPLENEVRCGLCGSPEVDPLGEKENLRGTAAAGTPAMGTPARGIPEPGTPAPGTPAVGPSVPGNSSENGEILRGRRGGRGRGYARRGRPSQGNEGEQGRVCRCLSCGYEKTIPFGIPCNQVSCDRCGAPLHHGSSSEEGNP